MTCPKELIQAIHWSTPLKLSEHGIIKNKFINELHFFYSSLNQETNPVADDPPIILLDAFNAGGARLESKEKHQTLKLTNILSFGHGKHAIKLGGEFEYEESDVVSQVNKNGSFTFSSLEDYEWGLPQQLAAFPFLCRFQMYLKLSSDRVVF